MQIKTKKESRLLKNIETNRDEFGQKRKTVFGA